MKGTVKRVAQRVFSALGFEFSRVSAAQVRVANFENLALAFQHSVDPEGTVIPENSLRSRLLGRLLGTPPTEAYYIVLALAHSRRIAGDVCEFGVAQGETTALIANEIREQVDKRLHLFDSFEGLPPPTAKDQLKDDILSLGSIEAYAGTMSCPDEMVRARLKAIEFPEDRCEIHKGFIEQTINNAPLLPTKVSFAYVDFDFYEPILIALRYLYSVMPVGGRIIVDDYDYFSTGAKVAVDEFVDEVNSSRECYRCFVPPSHLGHFAVLTRVG